MARLLEKLDHRPELDGLRAIAVLAVVLYHAELGVPGGFVGVDVFFVISGYLITSLILQDLQCGTFTLAGFWERRARRLLPALGVVVLLSLLGGWLLLLPADFGELGRSASFQAVFAANIYFWLHTGYFAGPAEQKALLHTWSLAVEEQFYVLLPLLLLGLFRFPGLRRRPALLLLLGAATLASLALSVWGVQHFPAAAFYLLPTRAWELGLGALVSLLPPLALRRLPRELLAAAGLSCVLIPCWACNKNTPFPGLGAAAPCLGTALLIWSTSKGTSSAGQRAPFCARLLALRPLVFVGLVSYSWYLWHWPLLALSRCRALQPLTTWNRTALVTLGFGLAILSWRFIETPFRKRTWCATRPALFSFAAASLGAVLLSGLAISWKQGFQGWLPPRTPGSAPATNDTAFAYELTADDVRADRLIPIGVKDTNRPISLLVWGDSHAMAAMPAFDAFLREQGLSGRQATHSGTAPLLGYYDKKTGLRRQSPEFNAEVCFYIQRHKIPHVALVAAWDVYSGPEGLGNRDPMQALLQTLRRLTNAGTQPWVFLEVPRQKVDVPVLLARAQTAPMDYRSLLTMPDGFNGLHGTNSSLLNEVRCAGARVIDPRESFLDAQTGTYLIKRDQTVLYRDDNHLTFAGAQLMLLPVLRQRMPLLSPLRPPKSSPETLPLEPDPVQTRETAPALR